MLEEIEGIATRSVPAMYSYIPASYTHQGVDKISTAATTTCGAPPKPNHATFAFVLFTRASQCRGSSLLVVLPDLVELI